MCANVGGCGTGSAQLNWLVADLAANDAQCTMALWHHPRFSSHAAAATPITQPLYQALYDANADLILTGHDHTYERFAPQTATGVLDNDARDPPVRRRHRRPEPLRTCDNPQPNSEVRNGDTYGVIKLQLKPTSFEWEFVPEAGKTFTDTGSDECHDANGPITTGGPLNGATPLTSPGSPTRPRSTARPTTTRSPPSTTPTRNCQSRSTSPRPRRPPARQGRLCPRSQSPLTRATNPNRSSGSTAGHGGQSFRRLPSRPQAHGFGSLGPTGHGQTRSVSPSLTDTHADAKRVGDITHVLLYGASPDPYFARI